MRYFVKSSAIFGCGLGLSMAPFICHSAGAATTATIAIQNVAQDVAYSPQIHAILTDPSTGTILQGNGAYGGYGSYSSSLSGSGPYYDIQGYLDTGTSGILLSQGAQQGLGVKLATYNGTPVTYTDTGLGGAASYNVSTAYVVATAPVSSGNYGSQPPTTAYTNNIGAVRMETSTGGGYSGGYNIFGLPVMQGKVTVFHPGNFTDLTNPIPTSAYIYNPGTPYNPGSLNTNPGIVPTTYKVQLSFASFSSPSLTQPSGAPGPVEDANPFIGPNPLDPQGSTSGIPPVNLALTEPTASGGITRTSTGSFLFDTGAQVSFISTAEAANLGISENVSSTGATTLVYTDTGKAVANQFSPPISGAGGSSASPVGFYLNSLALQTTSGQAIKFVNAPIVVLNITVVNPSTGQPITLAGDLGMNFFETGGLTNNFNNGFQWFTLDQPNGLLGLTPISPIPGDANGDGVVNNLDLATVLANLNQPSGGLWSNGDFTGSGTVTNADLAIVLNNLNTSSSTTTTAMLASSAGSVPEPASLALLAVGILGILGLKKSRSSSCERELFLRAK